MNRRDMLRASAAAAFSGGLRPPLASAEEPKPPTPDERIHKYLAGEVERITKNTLAGATTRAEWEAKRPELRRQFLDMVGLDPLPEKTPLKATVTGTHEVGGVAIEKLHFQSRPGLYVTGNLYRPNASGGREPPDPPSGGSRPPLAGKKLPAILYVCGHANKGRDGNKTAYQDHPRWFASNGYVCLAIDTLQLGEVAGDHHGTYRLGKWWWHSRGYTPAGVECWNGIRALDYLVSRPDVDPDKLGVTGISGGGATTVWVAAADDRVKVAVPVSGMSDLEDYVSNQVINGHCDCMFGYNLYRWEWSTILGLFAPKPLLFANSDADPIFPMPGNRRIAARLRKLYELFGAADKFEEYVSPGGHAYRPDLRKAVFAFINKHLKGDAGPVKDADFPPIEGKLLRAFPEDADLPKDAINATVDEVFVPKAEVKLTADAKDFPAWKAGLVKQLKEKVFRYLPPATGMAEGRAGRKVTAELPEAFRPPERFNYEELHTESGITVPMYGREKGGAKRITLVIMNPDDDHAKEVAFWAGRHPDDSLIAIYTRGGGPNRWTWKNPPNTVERSFALVGQTADSGRVWDAVVAASCSLGGPVRVVGKRPAGVIGAYAALLGTGRDGLRLFDEVVLVDPPASHRDGPHFLGVMRVLDIPEALGLLAPDVGLTLTGKSAKDPAFDRTAALYKLAGAEGKFKRG
ncbi:MAG: prolyl oligopeptidase family serine peptidase [Gemmataceae bacterium]|nr:prolyl oligopeptidase family serine peptidase [Gemmataceae bacterium]